MDVLFVEVYLGLDGLAFEGEVHERGLFGLDVVIKYSDVLLPLDVYGYLITVDVAKVLAFSTDDIIVLPNFDGILGKD